LLSSRRSAGWNEALRDSAARATPAGGAKEQLEQTLERADQAIAEGRSAVYDLRSSITISNDLPQAVRAVGNELARQDAAAFNLVVEGAPRALQPFVRDEFYRIAREALRNAFSHAQARHIEAEIAYAERLFRLRIRDDEKGISPAILEDGRAGHYGLRVIRILSVDDVGKWKSVASRHCAPNGFNRSGKVEQRQVEPGRSV
jgi:signal transduction histidine kinase